MLPLPSNFQIMFLFALNKKGGLEEKVQQVEFLPCKRLDWVQSLAPQIVISQAHQKSILN